MFKRSCLRNIIPALLLSLLLFGCAFPNAITAKNRSTPVEGRGLQLMPPKEGSQWRYGTYDQLGLVGFYSFNSSNDGQMKMKVVQGWVEKKNRGFMSGDALATLLHAYKSAEYLQLDITRHELTETIVDGRKIPTLQMWGTHKNIAKVIATRIIRFNSILYVISSQDGEGSEYFVLGGWISHLTQGEDNPLEMKTDWTFVEEMIDGVLPRVEGSGKASPYGLGVARPFVFARSTSDDWITFYTPLHKN